MGRVVVAGVGFNWRRVLRGVYGIGVYPGDRFVLVNSEPREPAAVEAMGILSSRLGEPGLGVVEVWLDPSVGFEVNVARLRAVVEGLAPCSVMFLVSGGLRWLTVLLMVTAMTLNSIGQFLGVKVGGVRVELEEEAEDRGVAVATPYIEIPVVPKLANITAQEFEVLKLIAERRAARVKWIVGRGVPRTSVVRRLKRLVDWGLVKFEVRGKGYLYTLTPLGFMFAGRPEEGLRA